MSAVVDGVRELNMLFEQLKRGAANKIARPALSKAGQHAVKVIKAAVPSRLKDIRKAIGYRIPKTKFTAGIVTLKVGAAVGKRRQRKIQDRTGRPGVGIGTPNVHWFFLGTDKRYTGTRRIRRKGQTVGRQATGGIVRYTGRMPKQMPSVSTIVGQNRSALLEIMRKRMKERLEAEVAKGPRKRR